MRAIEIRGLGKSFGGRAVLRDVSFSVQEGEVFGYLGPNGAGKTTTMRILLGLLRPTSGSALVKGIDLGTDDEARRQVGALMENDGLYDRISARRNLDYYARLYGVRDRPGRVSDLLDTFGLKDRQDDKVFTFSKGMRRKLGIARAIVHDPDILLLDEPTSGLDPEAQRMVRDILTGLSRRDRMTVLLSSHNLDEVQKACSRVAVIKSGEIRACDSVDHLRDAQGVHTLTVVASTEADVRSAESLLRNVPTVTGTRREGTSLTVTHIEDTSAALIAALAGAGVRLEEVRKASRSLEDVYIDLVREQEAGA